MSKISPYLKVFGDLVLEGIFDMIKVIMKASLATIVVLIILAYWFSPHPGSWSDPTPPAVHESR